MGLLRSLAMLFLLICFFCSPRVIVAQNPSQRDLDALLQDYAFRAFTRKIDTGIPYDGVPPSNLPGVQISAMRLRSGSLRRRGVRMYKEFRIPVEVVVQPYVERLVLVYQNLGNWSHVYYELPGYVYLAPVLGLLAYNGSDLSAKNLPKLDIKASKEPISVEFSQVGSVPSGSVASCVWFNLHGMVKFDKVEKGNKCSTVEQGHFSIVVESTAPAPAPPRGPSSEVPPSGGGRNRSKVWIIVVSVVGGFVLLLLLVLLIMWVRRYKRRKKMHQMEKAAEAGEALHMTSVGNTKAPAAMVTRTQPTLETEYVP